MKSKTKYLKVSYTDGCFFIVRKRPHKRPDIIYSNESLFKVGEEIFYPWDLVKKEYGTERKLLTKSEAFLEML